jgi:hypothetical protein
MLCVNALCSLWRKEELFVIAKRQEKPQRADKRRTLPEGTTATCHNKKLCDLHSFVVLGIS